MAKVVPGVEELRDITSTTITNFNCNYNYFISYNCNYSYLKFNNSETK